MKKETTMELPAAAYPKEIGSLVREFISKSRAVAADKVALTNSARQIGLMISSWCGHEQPTFDFYQKHQAEIPAELTWDMVRTFVAISHKLAKPVERIEEVKQCWQLDFQAAGIMELPTRNAPQSRANVTDFILFTNKIANVRGCLVEWNTREPFEEWTDATRAAVKQQLQPLAEFYNEL